MIGQNSNNKPSGATAKQCDAGLPISGRTSSTGVYEVLKLNVDGSVPTSSPISATSAYLGINAVPLVLPPGAPPANTFIGFAPVFAAQTIAAGLYRINPTFIWDGAAGGGISFVLTKSGLAMGNYITTLPPFNAFAPTLTDVANGFCGYWHNTGTQILGGNMMIAYNRSQSLDIYLDAGVYNMGLITDGAVVFNGPGGFFGFYEFTKLG